MAVNVCFVTYENADLSAFFYSEQLPNWIRVIDVSIKVNNLPIPYIFEEGEEDEVSAGMTPYRWIIDDPEGDDITTVLRIGDRVDVDYLLIANSSGICTMDGDGWFSVLGDAPGGAVMGYDDDMPTLTFGAVAVNDQPTAAATLAPAWPNPFNPTTTLSFSLAEERAVRLSIHDARGCLIVRLADGVLPAGRHLLQWQGLDGAGRSQPSGVYFARLEDMNGLLASRRLVMLK